MASFSGNIGGSSVTVALGDMTKEKADAYVVPQFTGEASYGGVGGAISRAGADAGVEDYQRFVDKNGEQKFGQVVLTPSYGGNSQHLLHVASVGSGKEDEFETVRVCMFNVLKTAEQNGFKKIVAPAMGTGIIGRLTDEQSAKAMMAAIDDYAQSGGRPMDVSFFIYGDKNAYNSFVSVLQRQSYKSVSKEMGSREVDLVRWAAEMEGDAHLNDEFRDRQADNPALRRPIPVPKPLRPSKK